MMRSVSSSKFSFSFVLAVLFHLLLLIGLMMNKSPEKSSASVQLMEALQATVFDEKELIKHIQHAKLLTQIPPPPQLTRAEKRRLARKQRAEKRAADRLAAKKQKELAQLAKPTLPTLETPTITPPLTPKKQISTVLTPPLVNTPQVPQTALENTPPREAETQAALQAKKAQARERWLKKVAARKKAQHLQKTAKSTHGQTQTEETPTPTPPSLF